MAPIAVGQSLVDRTIERLVAFELGPNLPEEDIASIAFDVDAGFKIIAEAALGEVGAADDRLGFGAGLEVEDLRMEAP